MPLRRSPQPPQSYELSHTECQSLIIAIRTGNLHIIPLGKGFHIHFGDIDTMLPNCDDLSNVTVSFSNAGDYSIKDNYLLAHELKVPLVIHKLQELLARIEK